MRIELTLLPSAIGGASRRFIVHQGLSYVRAGSMPVVQFTVTLLEHFHIEKVWLYSYLRALRCHVEEHIGRSACVLQELTVRAP